jgi:MFS family permease
MNYVGFALASVFGPRMTDHFGRRKVIIPGLFVCIFSEIMIIFVVRDFYFLLGMMFVYGLSGTCRISLMYLYM